MSAYRHRLKLSNPLESRDGTLAKDAKLKNMVTEIIEGKPWAVKRPGITNSVELPTGLAQGVFGMNGKAYAIVNDSIYGPLSLTNNSGGGGSEAAGRRGSDPVGFHRRRGARGRRGPRRDRPRGGDA